MILKERPSKLPIKTPEDAVNILREVLVEGDSKENLLIMGLNSRNVPTYIDLANLGTLDSCLISPRDVFRLAIIKNSRSIIMAHNHPSGDASFSREDEIASKAMAEASKILDIKLVDSLVITDDSYASAKSLRLI